MFKLTLGRNEISTLLSPSGVLDLVGYAGDIDAPFTPNDAQQLVKLTFNAEPSEEIELGKQGSVNLGVKGGLETELFLIWPGSNNPDPLNQFELQDYFANGKNADKFLMVLIVAPKASADAKLEYKYSVIELGATLSAGLDGSFAMTHPFDKDTPAKDALIDFFNNLTLPSGVSELPKEGEVLRMEYGGYLSFGASLGLGYELTGSGSHQIRDLQLSEVYKLSLLGKLELSSKTSGRFVIDVRKAPGMPDNEANQWAWVRVNKSKNKNFQIAAGVDIGLDLKVDGAPESLKDMLETTLGLKAQNWLNLFDKAKQYSNFDELDKKLDNLAKGFIEEWVGKAFSELNNIPAVTGLIKRINNLLDKYHNLGDHAVKLFDHYYDPINNAIDGEITKALNKITEFTSMDQLKGNVIGGKLADVIYLLTDGKPLDWLLGQIEVNGQTVNSLDELKQRAQKALSLISDTAHKTIRDFIKLAKKKFPLDSFLSQMENIDLDELKAGTNKIATGFFERMIGTTIDKIKKKKLGKMVTEVNAALISVSNFTDNVYSKIKESLNQSIKIGLQTAYNRNQSNAALLDIMINLAQEDGKRFMKAVGRGQFDTIFKNFNPDAIRINNGELSRQVAEKSILTFNIIGWHKDFKYKKITTLLTGSKDHIRTDENGMLTVYTDLELKLSRDETKNGERVLTNLVLGYLGATSKNPVYDEATKRFLIKAITSMSGKYTLLFEDPETSPEELDHYLAYVDDFGITTLAEAKEKLLPTMDKVGDSYGKVSVSYEVRFTQEGLEAIFKGKNLDEQSIRMILRKLTLLNYLNQSQGHLRDLGYLYWTKASYSVYKRDIAQITQGTIDNLKNITIDELPNPTLVYREKAKSVSHGIVSFLFRLYGIEQEIIEALRDLWEIMDDEEEHLPLDYEKRLKKFGDAMQAYDNVDKSIITFFAVFDALIKKSGLQTVRQSSLIIKAKVNEKETTKMLFSD